MVAFLPAASPAEAHPIHLSVMEVYTEPENEKLGFSITFFMDDFGVAAEYDKYAPKINSGKMTVDDLILSHLQQHLKVKVNGKSIRYQIREKESNFPAVTCYMEVKEKIREVQTIEVENTLLLDMFNDQKNMVHLRIPGKKEGSMILNRKKKSGLAEW
jgi:hypothetical protein